MRRQSPAEDLPLGSDADRSPVADGAHPAFPAYPAPPSAEALRPAMGTPPPPNPAATGTLVAHELSFCYPGRSVPTLHALSFQVLQGQVLLLAGPTGSGKSTLLKCLAGLIPHHSAGELTGSLHVDGVDVRHAPPRALARHVGMVLQTPDTQLCATRVEDEVAFGLENLCLPVQAMRARITRALEQVGLSDLRLARVQDLSGGQKQRLVIAAALAMEPRVLLLDEPISQLDPVGAREIRSLLLHLKREQGLTLVLVEHRIDDVAPLADRVMLLDQGRIVLDRPAAQAWKNLNTFRHLGLSRPALAEWFETLGRPERPLQPPDALALLDEEGADIPSSWTPASLLAALPVPTFAPVPAPSSPPRAPCIVVSGLSFRYHRRMPLVLNTVSFEVQKGERIALLGANGSGKSTLLACLAGLHRPSSGQIQLEGELLRAPSPRVGLMFQDPDLMLLCAQVGEELRFAPHHRGIEPRLADQRVQETLSALNLGPQAEDPPLALSRGQRLRVALGSVLTAHPGILLLDEPTSGQDRQHIEGLLLALAQHASIHTWIFATHDVSTALSHATRCILLAGGKVLADLPTPELLHHQALLEAAGLLLPPLLRLRLYLLSRADRREALRAGPGSAGEACP